MENGVALHEVNLGNCPAEGGVVQSTAAHTWYACQFDCPMNEKIRIQVWIPDRPAGAKVKGLTHTDGPHCGLATRVDCGDWQAVCGETSSRVVTAANTYGCHGRASRAGVTLHFRCFPWPTGNASTVSDFDDGSDTYAETSSGGVTTRTYSSTQDWCTAMDNDGPGNDSPVGDADSCDGDSTDTTTKVVGPGDPTGIMGLFGWTCGGAAGVCQGGFGMFADTASGDGRFGGDYPVASSVSISANPPARFVFQVGYRDTSTGVIDFTGISLVTCVGDGSNGFPPYEVTVGGGGGWWPTTDPPAGTTIDSVNAGRAISNALCGGIGSASTDVTGAWTYEAQVDDSAISTSLNLIDNGDGTCTVAFNNSGSIAATRWGSVSSEVRIYPGGQTGNFQSSDEATGASLTATGFTAVAVVEGQTVTAATSAWAIGAQYRIAFSAPVVCDSVGP